MQQQQAKQQQQPQSQQQPQQPEVTLQDVLELRNDMTDVVRQLKTVTRKAEKIRDWANSKVGEMKYKQAVENLKQPQPVKQEVEDHEDLAITPLLATSTAPAETKPSTSSANPPVLTTPRRSQRIAAKEAMKVETKNL